nr:armadillo-like helical [Tanacetum cinerariifolium]
LKEVLGRARFLKSIQCKHDEGLVLVKVYFKRGDSSDLREYERKLARIREVFSRIENPHVWPFQFWLETDKAAYLLRQYFFNNLHDRLSTRPFLSLVEKKWLAFQLLYAVKQCHDNGICHGDIKCENVLVTSWNWLYLADFASFKPTYIPHDDPSDFSFFFDTGGRRRCYLAPERFYEHGGEIQVAHDAPLRPSMDIFAVGCVIAELFLEGQPLFELSQLLAYRRGQYDPSQHLEKIPDSGIRKMILHMIQLDPDSRCSAESYLQSYSGVVLPCYFSPFLHNLYSNLNPIVPDSRVAMCQLSFPEILRQMLNTNAGEETVVGQNFSTNVKDRILVVEH